MLFAVLTEADPRDLPIPKYLESVNRGHEYLQGLTAAGKLKQAYVRAGMAGGIWIIEARSFEELETLIQRNPTANYGRYQMIALSDPEGLSFSDSVNIEASPELVYALLWEVERWPSVLPHVRRVTLHEQTDHYQDFEMEAAGQAGPLVSRSLRWGVLGRRIQYEQVQPPPLFRCHRGAWILEPLGDSVTVTAQHTIELEPEQIVPALGQDCSSLEANTRVRHLVGGHSLSTLRVVKALAERQQSLLWDGDSA
jgi:aromatase